MSTSGYPACNRTAMACSCLSDLERQDDPSPPQPVQALKRRVNRILRSFPGFPAHDWADDFANEVIAKLISKGRCPFAMELSNDRRLNTIIRNTIRDHLRKTGPARQHRHDARDDPIDGHAASDAPTCEDRQAYKDWLHDTHGEREARETIAAVANSAPLSPMERKVLDLKRKGLTNGAIAQQCGVTAEHIHNVSSSILRKLRKEIEAQDML